MATLVKFRIEKDSGNEVFAYFPKLVHGHIRSNGIEIVLKTCYAHIGQHSSCSIDYVKDCRPAKESEYQDLKNELISIGYNLKICK